MSWGGIPHHWPQKNAKYWKFRAGSEISFKTHAALKLSLKDCLPNSHPCPSLPETVRCDPGLLRWQKRPNPKNGDREIVSSLSLPNMSAAPTGHQARQKKKWNKKEKLRVSRAEWSFPGVSPKSLANRVQPYVGRSPQIGTERVSVTSAKTFFSP